MKRFSVPCSFGDKVADFNIYIGRPSPLFHPLQAQSAWLAAKKMGTIPANVLDGFQKLSEIARKYNTSFESLCTYALSNAKDKNTHSDSFAKLSSLLKEDVIDINSYRMHSVSESPLADVQNNRDVSMSTINNNLNYNTQHLETFSYSENADLLLASTDEEMTMLLFRLAEVILATTNRKHCITVFVSLCFEVIKCNHVVAKKIPESIVEVYRKLINTSDLCYSFAVAADSMGELIPLFCRHFMFSYSTSETSIDKKDIILLHDSLVRFALCKLSTSLCEEMPFLSIIQNNLRNELMRSS